MRALLCVAIVVAIAGSARAAGGRDHAAITEGMDCNGCHSVSGWRLIAGAGENFDHSKTGFPLVGGHRATTCTACHDGRPELPTACAGCHSAIDAHAGRLGPACEECHTSVSWKDTKTMDRHRRTHLPLTGRHAMLDCAACHTVAGPQAWSNVPWDCYACHREDYQRQDIHPLHTGPMPFSHFCAQCHRTVSFKQATFDPTLLPMTASLRRATTVAAHDVSMPLSRGSHRGASCTSCHLSVEAEPRAVACTGCHAHDASTLRGSHRGRIVGTIAADCLACHPRGARR